MSSKCNITAYDGCDLTNYNNHNECILHCSKEAALKDYHKSKSLLETFYTNILDYILNELFQTQEETHNINKSNISNYLMGKSSNDGEAITHFLKKQTIVFNCIAFPVRDSRDTFDYLPLLRRIKKIHFNYCKFYLSFLELKSTECFFQDCEFYDNWIMCDYQLLENVDNTIYQACQFYKDCNISENNELRQQLSYSQFNGCIFNAELSLNKIDIKKSLFNDWNGFTSNILSLNIDNCIFEGRFILNNYEIEEVYIKNTIFKSKFEFVKCSSINFKLDNCNFLKLVEFYGTSFEKFEVFKSIFEDYTGFEKCLFGKEYNNDKELKANFNFATFLNFINFRNTNFYSGLSFEDTNLKEAPNFLNTNISFDNTSRETFRIIKHSFDKIGNHIEANKFFSLEMKKYKNNLFETNGLKQEKFIFWFNGLVSDFGQNYIKPIKWLLGITIIYSFIFYGFEENWIKIFISDDSLYFKCIDILNLGAKSFLPFKKFLPEGLEFLTLSFMFIQSTLIWHIISAIKRHTKR